MSSLVKLISVVVLFTLVLTGGVKGQNQDKLTQESIGVCDVPYIEDFDNGSLIDYSDGSWLAWSSSWFVKDGLLTLDMRSDILLYNTSALIAVRECYNRNFTYSARMRTRGTTLSIDTWGVVVRGTVDARGLDEYILFEITDEGWYQISHVILGNMGDRKLLAQGYVKKQEWSTFSVLSVGRKYVFTLNGKRVHTEKNIRPTAGMVGVMTRCRDQPCYYALEVDAVSYFPQ